MASIKQIVLYAANFSLIVICVLIASTAAQWAVDDDGCRTPDEGVGSCIPKEECQPITDFIKNSGPLNPHTTQMVERYYCGVIENYVKVCCPNKPIAIPRVGIAARTTNNEPPDVTNHKNVNLLPFECGLQFGSSRISGGNKTALFEFPWMALLSYEIGRGQDFKCGGTIINEWYILTAAHCVTNLSNLKLISIRVGEYNISSTRDCEKEPFGEEFCAPPVQDIAIEEAIPHPLYNSTSFINDIGLIRLAKQINLTVDNARPICLPVSNELRNKNFRDSNLTVTGWGVTETGTRSVDLLKVNIPVTTEENCRKAYAKSRAVISFKQICAGGRRNSDSCGGDSGGPLQSLLVYNGDIRYVQFGVVSFGSRFCGQEGFPGVYTRINYYMDWILDNMKPQIEPNFFPLKKIQS